MLRNHHLHIAEKKIEMCRSEIICLYGYCANGNLPTWKNEEIYIGNMTPTQYLVRPTNMACHNLCKNNPMPQGTWRLLGLGLKYYTLRARPTNRTNKTIDRAKQDIRRMAFSKKILLRNARGSTTYLSYTLKIQNGCRD